jgi:hypothetical protein
MNQLEQKFGKQKIKRRRETLKTGCLVASLGAN